MPRKKESPSSLADRLKEIRIDLDELANDIFEIEPESSALGLIDDADEAMGEAEELLGRAGL